jgi:alcohol dehydrogenase
MAALDLQADTAAPARNMGMFPFVHRNTASKVIFGPGALEQLAGELAALGIRRPLLLAGPRTARSTIYARVAELPPPLACRSFTGVPEHSSVAAVAALVTAARAHDADGFIALGGGSVSDTAKAASLLLAEGGELSAHASRFTPPATLVIPELSAPKLPIVAIPTTASGAEATASLGVRTDDARKKLLFWDPKLAARVILIDPAANADVPASIMLATGMNGLAHCIEGLYSKVRTPVTTALALHAIGLFRDALPAVAASPRSVECRATLLTAAHLSGLVLTNARTCLHHAICHALGAVTGASHGQANAVMLPHALAFNAPAASDAMAAMVRAWGGSSRGDAPATAIGLVRDLQSEIGVTTRLRDIGVAREALADVAHAVMGERGVYFNPRAVEGPQQIEALLQAAW